MMQKGYIQKKRDGHKSTKKYSPKDEGHSLKLRAAKIRKYFKKGHLDRNWKNPGNMLVCYR